VKSISVFPEYYVRGGHITGNPDPGSFQPDLLEFKEGEQDMGTSLPDLQITLTKIQALKNATLEDGGMDPKDIDWLRDPESACNTLDMSDTHLVKVL
jgi:hypothetical protein